jgi:hypothetical protein
MAQCSCGSSFTPIYSDKIEPDPMDMYCSFCKAASNPVIHEFTQGTLTSSPLPNLKD